MTIELDGNLYLTCCPMCQSEFEKDPNKYVYRLKGKHDKN